MKRILTLTIAALLGFTTMNAQEGYNDAQHEVALSYGAMSTSQWLDVFETIVNNIVGARYENERIFGPLAVEYFYHAKKWLGVGGTFVYGSNTQDIVRYDSEIDGYKQVGDITRNYFTLMPAVKFDWLRKKHFGLYSKAAFGATLREETATSHDTTKDPSKHDYMVHINWHTTLIGIEAGGSYLRGFVEAGVGEQGTVLGGLRYKF